MQNHFKAWLIAGLIFLPLIAVVGYQLLQRYTGKSETHKETSNRVIDSDVAVIYLSLRQPGKSEQVEKAYSGERGEARAGICRMQFKPFPGLQQLSEITPFYLPTDKTTLTILSEIKKNDFWKLLEKASQTENRNIIVYIHGYKNSLRSPLPSV